MENKLAQQNHMFSKEDVRHILVPILLETLFTTTVGVADTMMVARTGEAAVSGVGCFNTFQDFFITLFTAFGTGGAVVVGQFLGMKKQDKAAFASRQLLYVAFSVSMFMMGLFFALRNPLLHLVYGSIEEDVFQAASIYAVPILLSLPFLAVTSAINAVFRSMRRTRITMEVSIVINLINIVGNAFCLYVLNWGAFGVGFATLISRVVGGIILTVKIQDRKLPLFVDKLFKMEFDKEMMGTILRYALPTGIEGSIFRLGKMLMIATIASCGTSSIAAFSAVNNMDSFGIIPGQSCGLALLTLSGHACGANRYDEARYFKRMMERKGYLYMVTEALAMAILMPYILRLYGYSQETYQLTLTCCYDLLVCLCLFWPAAFVVPNALKGAGDVHYTMWVSIISMWLFRVCGARILGIYLGFGCRGAIWGMYIDWVARVILYEIRYRGGKWQSKGLKKTA